MLVGPIATPSCDRGLGIPGCLLQSSTFWKNTSDLSYVMHATLLNGSIVPELLGVPSVDGRIDLTCC